MLLSNANVDVLLGQLGLSLSVPVAIAAVIPIILGSFSEFD